MLNLRSLLQSTGDGVERLDKKVLLRHITGFSDAQLISCDDYVLSPPQLALYNDWLKRRQNGEPLAYIIGYREFYSRNFKVSAATLIPRPETELLVEEALKRAKPKARILDLGCGSGCIAITLKKERPDTSVTATDVSAPALDIARANSLALNAEICLIHSDWYHKVAGKYDLIVSNPPYIEANDEHLNSLAFEPQSALTDFGDGYSCIRAIIHGSADYLEANGWLLIEHGYQQGSYIRELFSRNLFTQVVTVRDYAGLERITLGQRAG